MSFFGTGASYKEVPGLSQYLSPLQNFDPGLGFAGRQAKGVLKHMGQGDYEGLASSFLSPIKDQYAVNQRENERDLSMGANAFQQGAQPGLMATIGNESRLKNQEGLGMSLASAIPQLYGQMSNTFGQARQTRIGSQLQGLQSALQGKLGGNQLVTSPSIFSQLASGAQAAGSLAGGFGLGKQPCWIAEALYGVEIGRAHV